MLLSKSASLAITLSTSFVIGCGGSSGGSKGGGAAGSRAATMGANLSDVAAIGSKATNLGLTDDPNLSSSFGLNSWGKTLAQKLITADDGSGDPFVMGPVQVLKDGSFTFTASFYRKIAVDLAKDVIVTLPNGKELWSDCRGKLRVFPSKGNAIDCLVNVPEGVDTAFAYDFYISPYPNDGGVISDKAGNLYRADTTSLKRYSPDGTITTLLEQGVQTTGDFTVTDDGIVFYRDSGILISPSGTKTSVSGDFVAAIDSKIILKSSDSAFKVYDTNLTMTEIAIDPQLGLEGSLDTKVADGKIGLISNGHTVSIDLTAKTLQAEQIVNAGLDAALFAGQGLFYISEQGLFYRQLSPQALSMTDAGAGNVALLEGVIVKSITKAGDRILFSGSENGEIISGAIDVTTMEIQKAVIDVALSIQAL